jgi:hypothetical protein
MTEVVTADALGRLRREVERHPYPLIFATISGAHLYGFPSPDSDYDLRGGEPEYDLFNLPAAPLRTRLARRARG